MTPKTLTLLLTAALMAAVAAFAGPARALGGPDTCPSDFVLSAPPEPDSYARLADRNGDGRICALRLGSSELTVQANRGLMSATLARRPNPRDCGGCGSVFTDNAVGNPDELPPGPCKSPFAEVGIIIDWRPLDRNGDGILCSAGTAQQTLVLLDNSSR